VPDRPVIADREELIYLLSEASELEHCLCCSYLFAAFSLKRGPDEGLTPTELEALARWERIITGVAVQEMGHLVLASNLLTALGAAPHLRRPNFPQNSRYFPPSIQLTLQAFDGTVLDHFIYIERPEGLDIPDAAGFVHEPAPATQTHGDEMEPSEVEFSTVGELYRDIEQGFQSLVERSSEERVFIGPPRAQATSAHFPIPGLMAVTDLVSARRAIEEIVEQGEGLRGDIENSHYARFLAIRGELDRLRAERSDFEPARPVLANPFVEPPADATGFNLIENPEARALADLFNGAYGLMVELLMRFFAHTEETHEELSTLAGTAMGTMLGVLKPLGPMLTSMPATSSAATPTAGPAFAFYRSIDYLPHRDAAWALFDERFEELAILSEKLVSAGHGATGLTGVHNTVLSLGDGLRRHRRIGAGRPTRSA
jgi:hypothetical protein